MAKDASGGGRFMDVRFDKTGNALFIVNFGVVEVTSEGPQPKRETGVVWKIVPSDQSKR